MAIINNFRVTNDLANLNLTVSTTTGNTITSLTLWTADTFKDAAQGINLTSLLTGVGNVETLVIPAATVGVTSLTSIYFVEVTTSVPNEDPTLGVTVDFTRFQICITDLLCRVAAQPIQTDNELHKALTYDMYIDSLRYTLLERKYRLAIGFFKNLDRVCNSECKICCDLSELARRGLGFSTVNNELILF